MKAMTIGGAVALAMTISTPVAAQTPSQQEVDNLKLEVEALKLEVERAQQKAELAKETAAIPLARIEALGLPEFENTTTLSGDKAGKMEAMLLSSQALAVAGKQIAIDLVGGAQNGKLACPAKGSELNRALVILTSGENVPWNNALLLSTRLDLRTKELVTARDQVDDLIQAKNFDLEISGIVSTAPTIIGAATAAARLFGQETTVSGIDLSVSDRMLMRSIIGALVKDCADRKIFRPGSKFGVADNNKIVGAFNFLESALEQARITAQEAVATKPAKKSDLAKALVILNTRIASNAAFVKALTTPGPAGTLALYDHARHYEILEAKPLIARVASEYSGGSFANIKNIATFFGGEPVRVSGGLIASYDVIDTKSGLVVGGGGYFCRSDWASLRAIQEGEAGGNHPSCQSIHATSTMQEDGDVNRYFASEQK